MTAADQDRLLGLTLEGRYQILALLGKGGMGRVYLAEERQLHRRCAIKLLTREHCENAANVERFLREAQVIARVRHENIVEIFSFSQDLDGEVFYAMELLSGQDLEVRLKDQIRGLPEWRELCGWTVQICRALAAVHDAGIVHRDIKPGNLFLTRRSDGSVLVKLLDFGIARPAESELTSTGAFLGTLPYMSPEQVQTLPLDGRSDIYALGILLYRAIAGRPPFRGDPVNVVQQHVRDPPPPLLSLAPGRALPVALLDIIDRCLRKSRDERYQNMREVEAALSALLAEHDPPLAGPIAPPALSTMQPSPASTDTLTRVRAAGAGATPSAGAQPSEVDPSQSALLTTRFPATHELPSPAREPAELSTLEPAELPTLEPDDSLVSPYRRFEAPKPDVQPPAEQPRPEESASQTEDVVPAEQPRPEEPSPRAEDVVPAEQPLPEESASQAGDVVPAEQPLTVESAPQAKDVQPAGQPLPGEPSPRAEDAPVAVPPTHSSTLPQTPAPRTLRRLVPSIALVAIVLLGLMPILRAGQAEGEPAVDPPTDLAASPEPVRAASTPDRADDRQPPPPVTPSPVTPPPVTPSSDGVIEEAVEGPKKPEVPSKEQAVSKPTTIRRPPTLAQMARRCRRDHGGIGLSPIEVKYTLSEGKVLSVRIITPVSQGLAACLETAIRNAPFPPKKFGIDLQEFL